VDIAGIFILSIIAVIVIVESRQVCWDDGLYSIDTSIV